MKKRLLLIIPVILLMASSCKKYLDANPNNKRTVPETLKDFQSLLDNTDYFMNIGVGPILLEAGTDDYHVGFTEWQASNVQVRNSYIWNKDIFEATPSNDWISMYQAIYYANTVLEGLENMNVSQSELAEYNRIKGSALFFRAFYLYFLEEVYGMPYVPTLANADLGVLIKLNTDLEERLSRSTVKQVYAQIEKDLLEAKDLLPLSTDFTLPNRPSRLVALACLARMYLTMQDYQKAYDNANNCLQAYDTLTDYNTKTLTSNSPFRNQIEEVMFDASCSTYGAYPVDSTFYNNYESSDLRKTAYFRALSGRLVFKGTYSRVGTSAFIGFATDELFLIRAECNTRIGKQQQAIEDLNTLLIKRWKTGTYQPYTDVTPATVLKNVLLERRKELTFRGIRWIDLRRLNQNGATKTTITRQLNGQVYTLEPNAARYTYPIPPNEIVSNPNINQTNR